MTTQVFFVTSQARNVLTVPLGALTFTETPAPNGGPAMSGGQGGRGGNSELAAQFRQNGGQITPEMRAQFETMRESGGFEGGGFPGGGRGGRGGRGGFGGFDGSEGGDDAGAGSGSLGLAGSIALSEPRNATVQLVQDDGTRVTREIVVGASDRVNAEVISGLEQGDRVVAGIIQERLEEEESSSNNNNNNNWNSRGMRGGFPF
jgi:macrolide-specific efflux system membrane fusion protein